MPGILARIFAAWDPSGGAWDQNSPPGSWQPRRIFAGLKRAYLKPPGSGALGSWDR